MFNLRYGLVDESHKQCYGVDDIGWNPEVFTRHTISLAAAKSDWVAFQVLLQFLTLRYKNLKRGALRILS
ncbi:hypothetical protein KVG29_08970 [Caldicoprobacter algeriensis]|uniref:hypothetical protein n=1 Tax=Caldicoprobacter algeriensis TaxID=699281 RepID=UPI0020798B28|nr:hypothetical protein [Caldicoprobacter algeriensis]MCM8901351.1 hypothetical protein [Caldicoprobacter algeriensis]